MSTIKSRWKWIRREAFIILVLSVVALFPSIPRHVVNLVDKSGLYDSGKTFIQERMGQRFKDSAREVTTTPRLESELQLAADQGDHLAQYRLLKNAGVDTSDLDGYLQSMYENQPELTGSQ